MYTAEQKAIKQAYERASFKVQALSTIGRQTQEHINALESAKAAVLANGMEITVDGRVRLVK